MCVPATSPNAQRDDARVVRRNAYARFVGKLSPYHYETSIFPRGDRRIGMVSAREHQRGRVTRQWSDDMESKRRRLRPRTQERCWSYVRILVASLRRTLPRMYQQLRRRRSGPSRVRHSEYQRRSSLAPPRHFRLEPQCPGCTSTLSRTLPVPRARSQTLGANVPKIGGFVLRRTLQHRKHRAAHSSHRE